MPAKRQLMWLLVVAMAVSGCSVHMAATGPGKKDLDVLQPSTHRDVVRAELGAPLSTGRDDDGNDYDVFSFVQGSGPLVRTLKTVFYLTADIFTLGLWEVIGTPLEGASRGTKMSTTVTYGPDLRVVKVEGVGQARAPTVLATAGGGEGNVSVVPDFKATVRENDLAIVIGIERYRGLPGSEYSKRDAALMKQYLSAMGFPERNIVLLTNDKASLSDIRKAVEVWLPNKARKEGIVFFYYSGHGAPDPATGEAYLVPFDGDPNYLSVTAYSLKDLYANLGKLDASEVMVVLDACFSGAGGRSVIAKGARPLVMTASAQAIPAHMAVLSATHGTQISASCPEKRQGIFTYYFLMAIKEGRKNLVDIYEYAAPRVEDEARKLNVSQTPALQPDPDRVKERFVLCR